MIKEKVAFLEGRLFSSQSGLFENFSDCSDWLDKSLCFDHVNRLNVSMQINTVKKTFFAIHCVQRVPFDEKLSEKIFEKNS